MRGSSGPVNGDACWVNIIAGPLTGGGTCIPGAPWHVIFSAGILAAYLILCLGSEEYTHTHIHKLSGVCWLPALYTHNMAAQNSLPIEWQTLLSQQSSVWLSAKSLPTGRQVFIQNGFCLDINNMLTQNRAQSLVKTIELLNEDIFKTRFILLVLLRQTVSFVLENYSGGFTLWDRSKC